jgi:hypothetical protein
MGRFQKIKSSACGPWAIGYNYVVKGELPNYKVLDTYEAAVSDFKNFLEIFLGSIEFGS